MERVETQDDSSNPALVFGISGEQGRSVVESFVDAGYSPVYGFTSNKDALNDQYLSDALQCVLLEGNLGNPDDVRKALVSTKATTIFLATTTAIPTELHSGFQVSQEEEYDSIVQFFTILKEIYEDDQKNRTVVFSTHDNVQELCRRHLEETGKEWIVPSDDGSIVPHFSAKGKGGEEALRLLEDTPGIDLILLTLPFLYSNFLGFFAPLPNEENTQWELTASFGDGYTKIDMMDDSQKTDFLPSLFSVAICRNSSKYRGMNLRVATESISMDEVAAIFGDLYGKDIIYNPLLPEELAALEFPSAPAMAQMCQYLGSPQFQHHDLELTKELVGPRARHTFSDWLLTHSDSTAFTQLGLDRDSPELTKICVFGATSPQGTSVIRGLLNDTRKSYEIRGTTRQDPDTSEKVQEIIALDPSRVTFVKADFDDIESCQKALEDMDGAFLVADLNENQSEPFGVQEKRVNNIIDACEGRVHHLVFSTMENNEAVTEDLPKKDLMEFSPKARAAAYARSKKLSVTFVLMPCYSETFFDMMEVRKDEDGKDRLILQIPSDNGKVMCMSLDELGPAVASIFDSYECFAGHEIGLVTDFISVSEVQDIFQDAFGEHHDVQVEAVDSKKWIEARSTYMKDLGQLFAGVSHSNFIANRHSIAKTFKLVPSARNLRGWVEQNKENESFREKLGLR
eukprot:scaffold22778_cov166-Cylindrotheca_fusiformis.AAC.4